MTTMKTLTGNLFFVSGLSNGREVFLGKAIDEPFEDMLTLEGKTIGFTPQGIMVVRPFTTLVSFPWRDPNTPIQQLTDAGAIHEAQALMGAALSQIQRTTHPLIWRWVESAVRRELAPGVPGGIPPMRSGLTPANPFQTFYEGFKSSAEQFRRALFLSPQVTTTRELDKLTALDGDLVIEIGKVTNQIAVSFNQVVARENELKVYLDTLQGGTLGMPPTGLVGGWVFLVNRLQMAKNWARRYGKTPFVREINDIIKNGITGLNEIILEHCSALDTLIAETFSQYGITYELHGEISPFASYTLPHAGAVDSIEAAAAPMTAVLAGLPT
ncbi:MAG: hypothetical protein E2O39_17455 [Planctomycetota bacterium]|nr:MAG: hypothetical protein E2O39_17455 [Planctomycetota bacterium]